jgi:tripartite-type tricarboxylate transporter receptor subunit TctC
MTFLSSCRPTFEALGSCLWLACLVMGNVANAQTGNWPERPIRILTPYAAGSAPDTTLRKITPELSAALGQPVIVENRPGAAGRIAVGEAAKAASDGYTFVNADLGQMILLPFAGANLSYDAQKDFTPVVRLQLSYPLIAVPATSRTLKPSDLNQLGRLPTVGVGGLGTFTHVTCIGLGNSVGFECNPVPYSQGTLAALFDVAKDAIDASVTYPAEAKGLVAAGKIRLLVTMAPKRNPSLPDVPSISEFTKTNANIPVWTGLFAPAGTPPHIIERLMLATNKILVGEAFKTWYESLGNTVEVLDGPGFTQFLSGQRTYLRKIVDTYGLKSE